MKRRIFAGITLALAVGTSLLVVADETYTIIQQRVSEPGDAGELFVFVGEHLSYEPKKMDCDDDCWVFDSWYTARYRVAQWIAGAPPGPELAFSVAEHSTTLPFGHSRYALVFVERHEDADALVKYQHMPVHPTADGGFASCGPLGDDAERKGYEPGFAGYPPLEDVEFAPTLVVDDARRLSPQGWGELHDPRWHEVVGNEVVCRRGVPVDRIARFMANDHPTLKAALPALAGGE